MARSRKWLAPSWLGAGEQVVVHTRTHAKALILPAVLLVVLGALIGAGLAAMPTDWGPLGAGLVVLLGSAAAGWLVVRPFLRWLTSTYTLTTRRLITRSGILNRRSQEMPLIWIHDVSTESSLVDRMFGCGTLSVRTGSDAGPLLLNDVPEVAEVHQVMSELIFGSAPTPPAPSRRR